MSCILCSCNGFRYVQTSFYFKYFKKLNDFGNIQIPAAIGELASGLEGQGRMAAPEDIVSLIEKNILDALPLKNKNLLITAGPTMKL